MRLALVTKINRPLGLLTAIALQESRHDLRLILAERRFAARGSRSALLMRSLGRHGLRFLLGRMAESVGTRLGLLRGLRLGGRRMGSLVEIAKSTGVELVVTDDANSPRICERLEQLEPDVIVLANAPIIKGHIIGTAGRCAINLHRSLLPRYAGLDAIFWALYNDERFIGATVHTVTEGIDEGAVVLQRAREVSTTDDVGSLTAWYYSNGPGMIVEALNVIEQGAFVPVPQNMRERSYFSWPTRQERKQLRKKLRAKRSRT